MNRNDTCRTLSVFELILVSLIVYYDILVPTLVILTIAFVSMQFKKEKLSTLGFTKIDNLPVTAAKIFFLAFVWTLIDIGLLIPILNHLTGTTQNLSAFEELKGNLNLLLLLLAASWTLAALGEEIVYRGFIQERIRKVYR